MLNKTLLKNSHTKPNTKKRGLASSETLHSMDAGAKAPWTGLRRVSDGARPLLYQKLKLSVLR